MFVSKCSAIGNGLSYMEMSFNITQNDPKIASKGYLEVTMHGIVKNRHSLHRKSFSKQLDTMSRDIASFVAMLRQRR